MLGFYSTGMILTAWRLFCLTALLMPMQAGAASMEPTHTSTTHAFTAASNNIYFIALPYLCAFHYDERNQAIMLRHDKNKQDLSAHQWVVSTTSIPEFTKHHGQLQMLDPNPHSTYKLTPDLHDIIIPMHKKPVLLLPLQRNNSASSPLWLQYTKQQQIAWHAPSLTPAVAKQIIAEKRKNARQAKRLSERMADRAFYFGYDTNDDALK